MNTLLLNYTDNSTNWGLNACSKYLLDELSLHSETVASVPYDIIHGEYLLDHLTVLGKRFYFPQRRSLLRRLLPKTLRIPLIADDFDYLIRLWLEGDGGLNSNALINKIQHADLVVFNAEGSCYRKNLGARCGLFLLYLSSKVFRKKALFVNGSITLSPVDNVFTSIIDKCQSAGVKFSVRELYSQNLMNSYGFDSSFCPDSAFKIFNSVPCADSLAVRSKYLPGLSRGYFCVSKSMLPMSKALMPDSSFSPFESFIKLLSNHLDLTPVILAKDSEDLYLSQLKQKLPDVRILPSNCNVSDLCSIIQQSTLLVSGRYHHLIFGLISGVPLIPLDTTSAKIKGLLYDTPYYTHIIDPTFIGKHLESIPQIVEKSIKVSTSFDSILHSDRMSMLFTQRIDELINDAW